MEGLICVFDVYASLGSCTFLTAYDFIRILS